MSVQHIPIVLRVERPHGASTPHTFRASLWLRSQELCYAWATNATEAERLCLEGFGEGIRAAVWGEP